ncbi:MAG: hypothetical protein ACRELB_07120, partial [Polyangiaceae bacterium]
MSPSPLDSPEAMHKDAHTLLISVKTRRIQPQDVPFLAREVRPTHVAKRFVWCLSASARTNGPRSMIEPAATRTCA